MAWYPLMRRFHKPNDEKRMVMMLTQEQCKAWLEGSLLSGKDIYRQYHAEHLVAQYDPLPPRAGAKEAYEAAETPPDSLF
ncbi:hypothetical protein [Janthinobacterium sp. Ant5-2-1]|uniref:hypothetical protein n=1 Tax=Janthinobacterium sp. Ant5-2-1 TaxID=1755239 RepID=UPI00128F18E9|nr:hypothetical protein [Janthinobacterium sp. Ant5-2-1]